MSKSPLSSSMPEYAKDMPARTPTRLYDASELGAMTGETDLGDAGLCDWAVEICRKRCDCGPSDKDH